MRTNPTSRTRQQRRQEDRQPQPERLLPRLAAVVVDLPEQEVAEHADRKHEPRPRPLPAPHRQRQHPDHVPRVDHRTQQQRRARAPRACRAASRAGTGPPAPRTPAARDPAVPCARHGRPRPAIHQTASLTWKSRRNAPGPRKPAPRETVRSSASAGDRPTRHRQRPQRPPPAHRETHTGSNASGTDFERDGQSKQSRAYPSEGVARRHAGARFPGVSSAHRSRHQIAPIKQGSSADRNAPRPPRRTRRADSRRTTRRISVRSPPGRAGRTRCRPPRSATRKAAYTPTPLQPPRAIQRKTISASGG